MSDMWGGACHSPIFQDMGDPSSQLLFPALLGEHFGVLKPGQEILSHQLGHNHANQNLKLPQLTLFHIEEQQPNLTQDDRDSDPPDFPGGSPDILLNKQIPFASMDANSPPPIGCGCRSGWTTATPIHRQLSQQTSGKHNTNLSVNLLLSPPLTCVEILKILEVLHFYTQILSVKMIKKICEGVSNSHWTLTYCQQYEPNCHCTCMVQELQIRQVVGWFKMICYELLHHKIE